MADARARSSLSGYRSWRCRGHDEPYADGAGSGVPQAQQIADRFHLALDLRTAVEQELARHRSFLSLPQPVGSSAAACEDSGSGWEGAINRQRIVQGRRDAKQALFETVRALHASGQTVSHTSCGGRESAEIASPPGWAWWSCRSGAKWSRPRARWPSLRSTWRNVG